MVQVVIEAARSERKLQQWSSSTLNYLKAPNTQHTTQKPEPEPNPNPNPEPYPNPEPNPNPNPNLDFEALRADSEGPYRTEILRGLCSVYREQAASASTKAIKW